MKAGYFEALLAHPDNYLGDNVIIEKLSGISNFKKITLLQAINVRLKKMTIRPFTIRNQKLWVEAVDSNVNHPDYLKYLYAAIYLSLVESMKVKKCKVYIPAGVNITLPTSEKSFIGNYPIGTSFDFSDSDNIVGINWKSEEGAEDLDLKMLTIDGTAYGWNAAYYNERRSVVFSGDMTDADPEATELFYTSTGFTPAIMKVNLYAGKIGSKFRFFLAKERITHMKMSYMVNPANIIVNVECQMDSKEKSLGVITENKFILAHFRTGKGKVAGTSITDAYTDYAISTLDCYVSLSKLLTDAGFELTSESPDVDLSNLNKDTLINLLA